MIAEGETDCFSFCAYRNVPLKKRLTVAALTAGKALCPRRLVHGFLLLVKDGGFFGGHGLEKEKKQYAGRNLDLR